MRLRVWVLTAVFKTSGHSFQSRVPMTMVSIRPRQLKPLDLRLQLPVVTLHRLSVGLTTRKRRENHACIVCTPTAPRVHACWTGVAPSPGRAPRAG